VLVVDDEEAFHRSVSRYLTEFRVFRAYSGMRALETLAEHAIDVVLLDLGLPDIMGLELLARMRADAPDVQVIVVTAASDIRTAVSAIKAGAFDFLTKQHESYQALAYHIDRAINFRRLRRHGEALRQSRAWYAEAFRLLENTTSTSLRAVLRLAQKTAPTPFTILIEGPSGAGKEIMARYLHEHSGRAAEPFVSVNVAAIPETLVESHLFGHEKGAFTGADRAHVGKFELAGGGTLFLDEIGELAHGVQVKLLRVLQEREVERLGGCEARPIDCRILCATNKRLDVEVAEGRFREDLYYRLCAIRIALPPLAERPGDIPSLVSFLARKICRRTGTPTPSFDDEVLEVLAAYAWPGNIRELENLVMRLCITCHAGRVTADDVPPDYWLPTLNEQARRHAAQRRSEERLYFLAREQFERYLVRHTVNRCGGSKRRAAEELGISYSTVKEKMRAG
jgi:DNA-binding NtrC family response regulator